MIKEENLEFLGQLIGTLETASLKLEEAYKNKELERFGKIKSFMLQMQKKISGVAE